MYDYGYGYDYGYTNYDTASSLLGGLAAVMGVIGIISLVASLLMIISLWKIYKKAGKGGWEAIVPIYNIVVLLQIVELPMWYIALFFVPFANIYAMFKIFIELAHKFGKSTGFGVLTAFFSFICLPILAFGKNNIYNGNNNSTNMNNNNIQTPQNNPNNAFAFQNQTNNMENNTNLNNQQPFMFNQNINTEINPMPTFQNMENNNMNNANPIPQENTIVNTITDTNSQPMANQTTPLSNEVIPQTNAFKYDVPEQPVNQQPIITGSPIVEPNGMQQPTNVMPGMIPNQQPMMPNQNNNNNPNI